MTTDEMSPRDADQDKRTRSFDPIRFHRMLDDIRIERDISWKEIARLTGVSASTLTRIGQGRHPDADNLSALIAWGGLDANTVLRIVPQEDADPIAVIRTALEGDPHLNTDGVDAIVTTVRTLRDAFTGRQSADREAKQP